MTLPHVPELLLILFIIVLIFGAGRLPEAAGAVGRSIKEFRRSQEDTTQKAAEENAEGSGKSA